MSQECSGCASQSSCGGACPSQEPQKTEAQLHTTIKNIIVVMSGKGGVGKSSFSSLLAITLQEKGHQVGLLDADITGPSIPKLFGVQTHPEMGPHGMEPVTSAGGIRLMSMNFLLPNEDDPVVWRGPVIAGVVTQFIEEVCWGELDYLIVDLPPGTGDVPLTILQTLPVSGVLIVTTPQALSNMVVRKGIKMLEIMDIPALGLVENMSYALCPHCDERVDVFGASKVEETAKLFGLPVLGRYPLDGTLAQYEDEGRIEAYEGPVRAELRLHLDEIIQQMPSTDA